MTEILTSFKRVTSVDVARRAGISQSTLSRTFSDDSRVALGTRDKVLAVARDLGCKPNVIEATLEILTERAAVPQAPATAQTIPGILVKRNSVNIQEAAHDSE